MTSSERPRTVDADRFEAVELDDEIFLLDRVTGDTFRMNRTGTIVWRHLARGSTVEAARDELHQTYPGVADRERVVADVDQFVDALQAAGALVTDA